MLNFKGEGIQVARGSVFRPHPDESYEIDVYYEFKKVGVRHRVAIECKDWKGPVDQGKILEFHQKIKNIGDNLVGVFISRSGYQSGAANVAKRHGILALEGNDVPSIPQLLAGQIKASLLPEAGCLGEPFWYVAELSADPNEGTGTYYAFPEGCPVQIPLFLAKSHAEVVRNSLPDKEHFGVFGMPQYKLRGLLAFAVPQKVVLGLVLSKPKPTGEIEVRPISAEQLRDEYLVE